MGVDVVAGAVGGHFAFCAMWELGVGRVLGWMVGREGRAGRRTYCNGVATRAVVAVVVVAEGGAGGESVGVEVDRIARGVSCGERWGDVWGEEDKDVLERPFCLGW